MEEIRIVQLKESVLEDNNADAENLRQELKSKGTCLLNLMSSPGSGKTSTLLALNKAFNGRLRWGVMEADIDSDVDARTMKEAGLPSVQLHTGGMCHLDADMTRQGIAARWRCGAAGSFCRDAGGTAKKVPTRVGESLKRFYKLFQMNTVRPLDEDRSARERILYKIIRQSVNIVETLH